MRLKRSKKESNYFSLLEIIRAIDAYAKKVEYVFGQNRYKIQRCVLLKRK